MLTPVRRGIVALCAAGTLVGCADQPPLAGPAPRLIPPHDPRLALLDPSAPGIIAICSAGGSATFTVTASPATGTLFGGGTFTLAAGTCANAWTATPGDVDDITTITVKQTSGNLASIDATAVPPEGLPFMTVDQANQTVSWLTNADHGGSATFNQAPPPPPTATCVTINATAGVAITPVTMTGSGGTGGPYTFSATGLPDGVTMSSDGTISGTPTIDGTFTYTVTVTDKDGNVGTVNCSVTVSPPAVCNDVTATNFGGPAPCVYPPPCPDGSFTSTILTPNGDLFIKYDQFPAPNDNSYGVNAVGWPRGHKFNDLVGSDHAGFQLADASNTVRLSFNVDYLTASSTAPSGYASLGVTGGDGKMLVGTASGITATTSLANNLNNINIPGLFNAAHVQQFGSVNVLINSPPTDALHQTYNISDASLAGWDFHDTYFVTISAAKLASIGYDPNTWTVGPNPDQLHNSPAKACPATGGGACAIAETKVEVKDKQVKVTIANNGTGPIYLSDLLLNWPTTNGKLMQVKLDGDVVYDNPDISGGSAHLTLAQLVADQNKRKIDKGTSDVLTFVFEKNADSKLADYSSTVTFGNCSLVILPK